jgi:hypothetical protein
MTISLIIKKLNQVEPVFYQLALLFLILLLIQYIIQKTKKNRRDSTLLKNGYGYEENGEQKIKYIKFFKWILFIKYNQGKTLMDFQKEKEVIEDAFQIEISSIKRTILRTILIKTANLKKTLKRKKNQLLIGWTGEEYIYLKERADTSIFISGTMGFGKTILLKSLIAQFKVVYPDFNKISIVSSKPEDFDHCLTYADNEDEILEELITYENQRIEHSKKKIQMSPTLIIFDEVQNITKEMGDALQKLIKQGRSQNFFCVLATQSSSVSEMKNLPIVNMSVKIICRNSQSIQSAEQLFDRATAEQSYFTEVPMGYGFIKTSSLRTGKKIKFYYEQGIKFK